MSTDQNSRTLAQLQDDAALNADVDRNRFAVPAIRRIVAEAWMGGRAEVKAESAVPDGSWQEALNWLKACLQGYDYLLIEPEEGLAAWQEARARGEQRIIAACARVAALAGLTEDQAQLLAKLAEPQL
jgi:hypothetical protein